jgi:hypothetical protein
MVGEEEIDLLAAVLSVWRPLISPAACWIKSRRSIGPDCF